MPGVAATSPSAPVRPSRQRDQSPSSYVTIGGELRLSNPGQLELLRGMAERGVPLRTTVRGYSMTPFVRDGDVVTIVPMAGGEPHIGDVTAVALPGNGRMAVHRVIARSGAGWLVRGDNCSEADGVFTRDAFVGRVVRVERRGRDVRLGLGAQGAWVAALSRDGWLGRAKAVRWAPHRAAARALRAAQGLPAYRRAGRRLAPRVAIVPATAADMEAVYRHYAPGVPAPEFRENPNVVHWVARHGTAVVGFVEFVHHPEEHAPWVGDWLFSLEVWATHRGLGIGEALTRTVMAEARARGAAELRLVVFEDAVRAVRLYRKLGFARVTVAALEPLLAAEKAQMGRRRFVMSKRLDGGS